MAKKKISVKPRMQTQAKLPMLPHDASIYRNSARAVLLLVAEGLADDGSQTQASPRDAADIIYAATQLLECADIADSARRAA